MTTESTGNILFTAGAALNTGSVNGRMTGVSKLRKLTVSRLGRIGATYKKASLGMLPGSGNGGARSGGKALIFSGFAAGFLCSFIEKYTNIYLIIGSPCDIIHNV